MYKAGGMHIFIDIEVKEIPDMLPMTDIIRYACEASGATVMDKVSYAFGPKSYTIVLLLAESHASVHTWPEHNFMSLDFFFCGDANFEAAIEAIQNQLEYTKIKIEKHRRGETYEGTYR